MRCYCCRPSRTRLLNCLSVLMCVLALCVYSATALPADSNQSNDEYYELMRVFIDTFEQVDRNYVTTVDRRELIEAAIHGMISKLDQYSDYISPDDLARFNQQVEQEFGGIGIQVHIDPESRRLTVMTPLPGTPAYKAGVRAGDTILKIEKDSTEGFGIGEAVKRLKGKPGESVQITIQHLDETVPIDVTIVRDVIQVSTVLGDYYKDDATWDYFIDPQNKIAYIRLTHFSRRSVDELEAALKESKAAGMKGLVLDLRFNPGGLLSQATAISDLFIEEGKIVSTKGRNSRDRSWTAKKPGTYSGFPMAILVNRYSASASEIVSACLQDHKRAMIVGERTWGKGSVQNVIELEDGESALKLTTASYHRPSGRNIHRFEGATEDDDWGVIPDKDFQLKMTNQDLKEYLKYRRERDILKKGGPVESEFVDKQLALALDYLKKQIAGESEEKQPAAKKPAEEKPAEKKSAEEPKSAPAKKDAKAVPEQKEPAAEPVKEQPKEAPSENKPDAKKPDAKSAPAKEGAELPVRIPCPHYAQRAAATPWATCWG